MSIEDTTQLDIHKNIPINKVPDNPEISEEYRLKPFPMVFGYCEKAPLVKYAKEEDIQKSESLEEDGILDEIITKIYLAPDAIDESIVPVENVTQISGFKNHLMNTESYNLLQPRYETPLHVYDGGYARVINNYITVQGEDEERNDVFIKFNKYIVLQKIEVIQINQKILYLKIN